MFPWLNRRLFGISPAEASFARRAFPAADPAKQTHLEQIGRTFIAGYLAALETSDASVLTTRLNGITAEFRGFAFEGAAMALGLADHLWGWRSPKFNRFLNGPAAGHVYMLYIGYGWAVARLPWLRYRPDRSRRAFHTDLNWLTLDGYGFHEGYFHSRSSIDRMRLPRGLSGYAVRAFDQGLGRALWFFNGADVDRTAACVRRFPADRRADLWSGIGLAATYAGGVNEDELTKLVHLAGEHGSDLAQGAAFAAKARHRAGIPTPHTEIACRTFCRMSSFEAAALTDCALAAIQRNAPAGERYETWRSEIRSHFRPARALAAL